MAPQIYPCTPPSPPGLDSSGRTLAPPKPTEQSLPKQRVATGEGQGTGERQMGPGHQEQPSQWLRTGPREVVGGGRELHMNGGSKGPVHAPLSHRTSLTKHKVKGKITENFKMVTAEH